jgi:uncharacterized protein (TIGR00369 family)
MPDTELSDEEQRERRDAVRERMPRSPFIQFLGLVFDDYQPDDVTMRLPFRHDLTNDGAHYHGGVVASVIDTCGAAAAFSNHDFSRPGRATTVAMSVQYVGACDRSDLVCRATTFKRGKELIFTQIDATDSAGKPVAHGLQTYRIAP